MNYIVISSLHLSLCAKAIIKKLNLSLIDYYLKLVSNSDYIYIFYKLDPYFKLKHQICNPDNDFEKLSNFQVF